MSPRTLGLDEALQRYLLEVSAPEEPAARELREYTAALPEAVMQISPEQGRFLHLLLRLMNAERALEVGTFTGYSALCLARGVGARGRVVCLDRSAEWTAVAREHWARAGVAERIELRLGDARESLDRLCAEGQAARFDFAFLDADKQNYAAYYERLLELVRPGGLIAVDNTLWSGRVADPAAQDPETAAIRAFNAMLAADGRALVSLVPIGDGLTLARKH